MIFGKAMFTTVTLRPTVVKPSISAAVIHQW